MPAHRTRSQVLAVFGRDAFIMLLAFGAGAGLYLAGVKGDPIWPQDYAGTLAAGCSACLLRMFPPLAPKTGEPNGGRG